MKREVLLAGILSAALMLGCTACADKETKAQTVDAEVTAEGETKEEAPVEYPGLRDLGEMLAEAEGVDYDEVVGDRSGYKKGKLTEKDYVSRYVGIQFTLPEGYKMDTDSMTLLNDLMDSIVAEEFGIEEEFVFRCEMAAISTENYNSAAGILSIEMDTQNVEGLDETMEDAMLEQGYKTVSKWGQDWMYISTDQLDSAYKGKGDMYCKVYPDAIYMIMVMYDEDSVKQKKVLLSAFEETVRDAEEPAVTEE